ncbi:MAG: zinc ribbon domain-containing protein [Dehalococcoidia bacterium]|nr:zinc ribbon domain-containing protein [Dehalococcoidia bacterium]
MAIYEYYCPTCRERFEQRRPMSEARVATTCKAGHKAERTLSAFAMGRGGAATMTDEAPMMGGCCGGGGGGCACAN